MKIPVLYKTGSPPDSQKHPVAKYFRCADLNHTLSSAVSMDQNLVPDEHDIFVAPTKASKIIQRRSDKCTQCDFVSAKAQNLRKHLQTHSGKKTKKCIHCDRAFAQPGYLKRHLKTHSGEKPGQLWNNEECHRQSQLLCQLLRR